MAITRLNPMPLASNTSTESGSNLNDQPNGTVWWGNSFTNAPANSAGYFRVMYVAGVQVAYGHTANANSPTEWVRSYTNGTWQPWVRVDNGGLGLVTNQNVSSIITPASGITLGDTNFTSWGNAAVLTVRAKGFTATTGLQDVGTVASGKRPPFAVFGKVATTLATYTSFASDGGVKVYWNSPPSTTSIYVISFSYLLR